MADIPTQQEIKINLPNEARLKSTIALSPTGDLQMIGGRDKLVSQMVRAIVNDDIFDRGLINSRVANRRNLLSLVTTTYRQFRLNQLNYVNRSDPDLSGFSIWRKAAGANEDFVRVSGKGVVWNFLDTGLDNNTTYTYGITKVYKNIYETKFLDTKNVTPISSTRDLTVIAGDTAVFVPGDNQVQIYVDFRKRFRTTEILNKIRQVNAVQNENDPRKWVIQVEVEDLSGNPVNVSTIARLPAASL